MGNENIEEHAAQLKRQPWEPAGVVSVVNDDEVLNYGKNDPNSEKGGLLSLEVEEIFHNKGIMEGTQNK
ncbi:MAG TPA: hypothetical protein VIM51_13805 [Desulfosporosinus sp.]